MAFTHHTTELNGQRYAYLDEGEGPLVVFGHGVLADKSMFEAQIEALLRKATQGGKAQVSDTRAAGSTFSF